MIEMRLTKEIGRSISPLVTHLNAGMNVEPCWGLSGPLYWSDWWMFTYPYSNIGSRPQAQRRFREGH